MHYPRFLIANALGGIVWAGGTTMAVYYLGVIAETWLSRFSWIGLIVAAVVGLTVGFLSARTSLATTQRAMQLGITLLHQGVRSKLDTYDQIADGLMLDGDQIAYMGDDILDLPVLSRVGLATAPSDAAEDVRSRVHWVSQAKGGAGAARELIELILRAQDRWDSIVATYMAEAQDEEA
jgi:3-deoxy-D-manno-octulosonate 8-phosphate phosphatase (KDO 8-P phosphatase)